MQHRSSCRDAAAAASGIHLGTKDIIPIGARLTNYKCCGMPSNVKAGARILTGFPRQHRSPLLSIHCGQTFAIVIVQCVHKSFSLSEFSSV